MKRRKSSFKLGVAARIRSCFILAAIGLSVLAGDAVYAHGQKDSLNIQTENHQPGQFGSPVDKPHENRLRNLDRRVHLRYPGWRNIVPTHAKVQYAGGMGFMSFGAGWDYGRKGQWETDFLIGFLPKRYSDKFHMTFTIKQNYIPWSISCGKSLAFEPLTCGMYINYISGEEFWIREPDRYPGARYYGFTSRARPHVFVGERLTYYLRGNGLVRNISLFYEFSANDLDIMAKCGNKSLALSDIIFFSAGIKLQMMR